MWEKGSERMRTRWYVFCGWLLMVCLLVSGCAEDAVSEETVSGEKVLRYVNYSPAAEEGLDPLHLTSSAEQTIACYLVEGLMRVYQYELRYGMADSYEISGDRCTYTFHLRENACYSDGEPVCAEDFKRAFLRLMEKENFNTRVAVIKNAEKIFNGSLDIEELGVTVIDEKTLQIELEHPMAQFLQLLALRAFSPVRKDAGRVLRPEDCNGPFVLGTSDADHVIRMEKNPYYWEKDYIALDAVEVVYLPDSKTAYEEFQKGKVDVMPIPQEGDEYFTKGIQRRVMTGIYENLYLDLEKEGPLQCKELRQALHYALNREEYQEALGSDSIEPNARVVPAAGLGICQRYVEEYQDPGFANAGNLKLARERLREALKALQLSEPDDVELTLAVHDDGWSKKEGEELKRQWEEKLGIRIALKRMETEELYDKENSGRITLSGFIAEHSDIIAYLEPWGYDYGYGTPGEKSDAFIECLKEAELQSDERIRLNTLFTAEKILMEDVPVIPLQLRADKLLLNPRLTGFETSINLAGGGYEFLYADFE